MRSATSNWCRSTPCRCTGASTSAPPSPARPSRRWYPHHLIDVADPTDEWSVVRFQQEARAAVADIERRGKRALLVGGTGLYVQAVVDPLTFPPEDRAVRDAILARGGDLHAELNRLDPDAAAAIEPGNTRRLARALEVIEITGKPFSSFGTGIQTFGETVFPIRIAGVWLPRDLLNARIDARVTTMREAGLVDEVRRACAIAASSPAPPRRPSGTARCSPPLMVSASTGTPVSARRWKPSWSAPASSPRRQRMWFRRDPRISWFGAPENACTVLPALLASWSA